MVVSVIHVEKVKMLATPTTSATLTTYIT